MSLQDLLKSVEQSYSFRKVATVKGVEYGLQVLSIDQERIVNAAVMPLKDEDDPDAYFKDLKKQVLSRAIVSLNGEDLPGVVELDGERKDRSLFLIGFLSKVPESILEALFDAYIDLREESEQAVEKEMKYDWFKTPEQRRKEYMEETEESDSATEESPKEKIEDQEESEEIKLKPVRETQGPVEPSNSIL